MGLGRRTQRTAQGDGRAARSQGPRHSHRPGLSTRQAAIELLDAVLVHHRALDDALSDHVGFGKLSVRDRAFARTLVATTLRRLGQIDRALADRLTKPLAKAPAPVPAILRLGVAQLWFLDTPAHAVVSTATDLAATNGAAHAKGMVNAVLRGLATAKPDDPDGPDAARLNTPGWLWERLITAYGPATADAIGRAHLADPPLDLSVRDDREAWAVHLDAMILPTGSLRRVDGGAVATLPGYDDGAWWVQDAAAALPARLFGEIAGRTVVDLCAAPGGKTAQLATAGANVTAVDQQPHRMDRLADNLARLALTAERVVADATTWRPPAPVPAVLLDAPCTATGTIRRHPDIPHLKRPGDVAKTAAIQARLLDNAVDMLAPGGTLVWCTCSLLPDEGEDQIARLIDTGAPVTRLPIEPDEVPGLAGAITPAGELRTLPSHWPNQGGLDGFHISRLRRVS